MKPETISSTRLRELVQAVAPYQDYWQQWTQSQSCFLTARDLKIIELYLKNGSHDQTAKQINSSVVEVAYSLMRSIARLNLLGATYQQWRRDYVRSMARHSKIKTAETPVRSAIALA